MGRGREKSGGWRLPTSEELLMGTNCADADLLVDDVHSAEAGGIGSGEVSVSPLASSTGRDWGRTWHCSLGVPASKPGLNQT